MKLVKKIEIKLTVRDNQFLKEQLPYLQRCCNFSAVSEEDEWYDEETDLVALVDSDEFIITLDPVTHRNGELTIADHEIQYIVRLEFKGTSLKGYLYGSCEPYVLLTPSEVLRFIFPNVKFNAKSSSDQYLATIDDYVDPILNMVFGFKNEEHFNYEII
jgi:hypothetical protein